MQVRNAQLRVFDPRMQGRHRSMKAEGLEPAETFAKQRRTLTRVAYRMLGSVADAEDAVQEAFIRWMSEDRSVVLVPEAFLRRVVTRICLDQLKSARHKRETYLGPWLPEPFVEEEEEPHDITLPLMLALERLSPLERAAFLLHDVFGVGFEEIAMTLERNVAACRQLAARARDRVREARPRYPVDKERGLALAEAFFTASRSGDMKALAAMLAKDVSVHADGGGKRPTVTEPVVGLDAVLEMQKRLAALLKPSELMRVVLINGLPGFITLEADGELQTTALAVESGKISAIYVMRNPDKLRHLH